MDAQCTWDELLTPIGSAGVTTIVVGNCGIGRNWFIACNGFCFLIYSQRVCALSTRASRIPHITLRSSKFAQTFVGVYS